MVRLALTAALHQTANYSIATLVPFRGGFERRSGAAAFEPPLLLIEKAPPVQVG